MNLLGNRFAGGVGRRIHFLNWIASTGTGFSLKLKHDIGDGISIKLRVVPIDRNARQLVGAGGNGSQYLEITQAGKLYTTNGDVSATEAADFENQQDIELLWNQVGASFRYRIYKNNGLSIEFLDAARSGKFDIFRLDSWNYMTWRIFNVEAWQDSTLLEKYQPALSDEGVPGLYDAMDGTFSFNEGTGVFDYG